jgi:hydrogenase maturation protein HypF
MKVDIFKFNSKAKKTLLALGPESSGNFSVYCRQQIYFCRTGEDLFEENNFARFKRAVLGFLKKEEIKPDIILTDIHPQYRTTRWREELERRFKAKNVKIQHHLAHIFSSLGDRIKDEAAYKIPSLFFGLACDGTGYGIDGKIWGGEIFLFKSENSRVKSWERIGHLENQILLGGDLAVREPARMLISILDKFLDKKSIYNLVRKYYTRNEFEILYNQLQLKFNCEETSSTARVLDAVSVLLGFSKNIRDKKHGPVFALEKNSTSPYNLKPRIEYNQEEKNYFLSTTWLFKYLLRNMNKDKRKLAATAQWYLARGLHEIIKKTSKTKCRRLNAYFSGGMADNKIMSRYFSSQGFYLSRGIPRGDASLSVGQILYYLLKV